MYSPPIDERQHPRVESFCDQRYTGRERCWPLDSDITTQSVRTMHGPTGTVLPCPALPQLDRLEIPTQGDASTPRSQLQRLDVAGGTARGRML